MWRDSFRCRSPWGMGEAALTEGSWTPRGTIVMHNEEPHPPSATPRVPGSEPLGGLPTSGPAPASSGSRLYRVRLVPDGVSTLLLDKCI